MISDIRVEGLDEALKKLHKMDAEYILAVGIEWGMATLVGEMMEYPPMSEANRPDEKGRWYERGVGLHVRDYIYRTSENLRKKWHRKWYRGTLEGHVWSVVSYAAYVVGLRQQQYHMRRGWKQLAKAGKKIAPKVGKKIKETALRIWRDS